MPGRVRGQDSDESYGPFFDFIATPEDIAFVQTVMERTDLEATGLLLSSEVDKDALKALLKLDGGRRG